MILAYVMVYSEETVLRLEKVQLRGLQTLEETELINGLQLPKNQVYEPELGTVIRDKLEQLLSAKGYYFAVIALVDIIPTEKQGVILVYNIKEGFSGPLQEIRFNGNRYFSHQKLSQQLGLTDRSRLHLQDMPALMGRIVDLYASRGYFFAQVSVDTLRFEPEPAAAVVRIEEGSLFKPENYIFRGNQVTRGSTLLKVSGLSQAGQITPEILTRAEANLLSREYIKSCKVVPLDGTTLGIEVTEGRMTKLEGVFGLATDPAARGNRLSGIVRVEFLNLWGTDRAIRLDWKSQRQGLNLLELAYHEAGLYRYPFAGDILFHRSRQDSAWVRLKGELSLFYHNQNNKLGTQLYTETLYPDSPDTLDNRKTNYLNTSFFWDYNRTDSPLNPSRGQRLRIEAGWLKRSTGSRYIPVTEIDAGTYLPLYKQLVLALGAHYREIADPQAKNYEQYKLGGFASLRGFREESFSSWRLAWLNTEVGFLLNRESRFFLLLDNGLIANGKDDYTYDLMGVGMGLSVGTRLGIISLSFALPVQGGNLADLNSGLLHLGLASSF